MDTTRGRTLIVLTALRFSEEYGAAALRAAAKRSEDVVLGLVVDRDLSEAVAGQLADVGFLGERLMHEFRETMLQEYRTRGLAHLKELEQEARRLGLQVETRVVDGAFRASVFALAQQTGASRIAVARMNTAHVSRLFFGSEIEHLAKEARIPVDVYLLTGEVAATAGGSRA
ncbi:MAG: universal stress protein [bacterium]